MPQDGSNTLLLGKMKCKMFPGRNSSHSHSIREVNVMAVIERGIWKCGEATVTYGTDKGSVSVVNCDVDTSETYWCKVATKGILTHAISAVLLLSINPFVHVSSFTGI